MSIFDDSGIYVLQDVVVFDLSFLFIGGRIFRVICLHARRGNHINDHFEEIEILKT